MNERRQPSKESGKVMTIKKQVSETEATAARGKLWVQISVCRMDECKSGTLMLLLMSAQIEQMMHKKWSRESERKLQLSSDECTKMTRKLGLKMVCSNGLRSTRRKVKRLPQVKWRRTGDRQQISRRFKWTEQFRYEEKKLFCKEKNKNIK